VGSHNQPLNLLEGTFFISFDSSWKQYMSVALGTEQKRTRTNEGLAQKQHEPRNELVDKRVEQLGRATKDRRAGPWHGGGGGGGGVTGIQTGLEQLGIGLLAIDAHFLPLPVQVAVFFFLW
jgi:hypothetical protein